MTLETARLRLRRWEESDAEALFRLARDPEVGPAAGWPPHQSVADSRKIIKGVLSGPESYAVCRRDDGELIGAIELKLHGHTDRAASEDECELGYWLGQEFWGRGLMPEATRELLRRAFADLGMRKVWCGHYDGNDRSRRVQEKVGFVPQRTTTDVAVPLLGETRTEHLGLMTRDRWLWARLHAVAAAARNARRLSAYVTGGEVAAAILSRSETIYVGVCVDTCSTLGICAERNAIFNMITCGEQEIAKVLAIMPDGGCGAPCGACRELMAQLMPESYRAVEIMLDYPRDEVVSLGELTPRWWI